MPKRTEAPVTLGLHVAAPAVTAAAEVLDEALDELDEEAEEEEEDDDDEEVEFEELTADEVELVDGIVPFVAPEIVALPAATA